MTEVRREGDFRTMHDRNTLRAQHDWLRRWTAALANRSARHTKSPGYLIFIITGGKEGIDFCGIKSHSVMKNTTPISKIMTRKLATVQPNDNLETVRNILEQRGFHHVPVVDQGKLEGIVSYTDYLRVISDVFGNSQDSRTNQRLLNAVLVKDVMTTEVICLSPDDTVEDALRVFNANNFHALPVTEGDRHLVGLLSTFDLIKMLEHILSPEIDYAQ